MPKGEAFFIPVDPGRFFAANPFEPEHGPPETPGLRFGAGCLSCGEQTSNTVTLIGGVRLLGREKAWEQVVPLCERCLKYRAYGAKVQRMEWLLAGIFSAFVAALLVDWLAGQGGWSSPGLLGVWVLAGVAAFGLVHWGLVARLGRWMMARSTYQRVDLVLFREPRKGEDTSIICLTIANDEQARHFAALNRHAIPQDRWNESYRGSRPHSERA